MNQKAFAAKQNGRPLSVYYGELTEIFQELDHRDKVILKHSNDVQQYRQSIEQLRIHIFLARLDSDFEQIQGEILHRDSSLDIEECYSIVRRETVCRITLNNEAVNSEASLVTRNRSNHPKAENNMDKSTLKCTHCQKIGHMKNKYFELVGYLDWWDHNRSKKSQKRHSIVAVVQQRLKIQLLNKPQLW